MPPTAAARSAPFAIAVVLLGLVAVSHGAIFTRMAAEAHPIVIAAFRLGIAALILAPVAALRCGGELLDLGGRRLVATIGAGVFLAGHFAAWMASLEFTSIANNVILVNLNPVWIALVTALITRMRPATMVIASIGISVGGSAIVALGSATEGMDNLLGDGLAVLGGMCLAGYLLLGRTARCDMSLLAYIAVCYGVGAIVLWIAVLVMGLPVTGFTFGTYGAMVGMAVVSQVVGHSSYNWALKRFDPGFVAVCLLGEPLLASLFGFLYFGEGIAAATFAGGALILAGIYLGARAELR
jgi:drug/metabolite transporter (DMT)-like permease